MTKIYYLGYYKGITNRIRMFPVQTTLGTQLSFSCPTANFGPLSKGQPHYLDLTSSAPSTILTQKPPCGLQRPNLAMRFPLTSGQSCFYAENNIELMRLTPR